MEQHPRFAQSAEQLTPERRAKVAERRTQAVRAWQEHCRTAQQTSLDIPDQALDIFVTEPLLVSVGEPARLAIRTVERSPNALQFFVVDQAASPEKSDWDDGDRAVLDYLLTHSERPHVEYYLKSGLLKPNEKLLLQLSLARRPNARKSIEFKQYRDRPELRRRGIGCATFDELARLKDLGFGAVVGMHETHNQSFYRDVLQRLPVESLTNAQKDEFDLWDPVYKGGTVQFL
ncbi:MAG TPA: hypothetical protein DEG44_02180 [Candidatus Kerfeldbacteria bacterium]|nr:hypothetical protein [Candidatus Kerfeldbacteria bacterium]